jgi:hypothetical protein
MKNRKYLAYKKYFVFLLSFCSLYGIARAQTNNYWSWNLNTPSTLLAGAVVGGNAGPSSVFYNPALIDHDKMPLLSLSASIISVEFLKAENIAGDGIDADRSQLKIHPRFISYILPNKNPRLGMEASILTPVKEDSEYTLQHFDELDIIQRTEGLETYSGYLNYSRRYNDTWIGFGASYKLTDQIYFGLSSFLTIKSLKYQYNYRSQAFQEGDSVVVGQNTEPKYIAESSFDEELRYTDFSFVFKGGAQFISKNERLSIGVNITFPNINLAGQADVRKAFTRNNVYDNSVDAFTANKVLVREVEKVKTRVKTPFSSAIGLQYYSQNKKTSFTFTLEYFHEIDPYAIISPPGNSESNGDYLDNLVSPLDFLSYYHEASSVTNAGVGFKQIISPSFVVLGGFRTDFTSGKRDNIRFVEDKFKINQLNMDKYHFTIGPVYRIKRLTFVTGLQYTFGNTKDFNPFVNFANPVEFNPETRQSLEGVREGQASASIKEIAIFFGVSVNLDKEE